MIELTINVSDIDYDAAINAVVGDSLWPALLLFQAQPDSTKEEMIARYINTHAEKLEERIENALAERGVILHISGSKARAVDG